MHDDEQHEQFHLAPGDTGMVNDDVEDETKPQLGQVETGPLRRRSPPPLQPRKRMSADAAEIEKEAEETYFKKPKSPRHMPPSATEPEKPKSSSATEPAPGQQQVLNTGLLAQRLKGQKAAHGSAEDNPGPVQPGLMSQTTKTDNTKNGIKKLMGVFQKKE